ncbi:MAG: LysE family translocator, partial [Desulfovibrionales bacterium]|nr:LysE family translocator [Desulfovibrionales bacterium]
MIPMDVLLSFVTASVLLALAPGPDNIFVLTQSAVAGPRAGILVMLGLCTGLIFHTLAVAMGVAVIFQTSALAFAALKYLGAAYLVYLAYLSFRAGKVDLASSEKMPPLAAAALYRRGIVMNITNPK